MISVYKYNYLFCCYRPVARYCFQYMLCRQCNNLLFKTNNCLCRANCLKLENKCIHIMNSRYIIQSHHQRLQFYSGLSFLSDFAQYRFSSSESKSSRNLKNGQTIVARSLCASLVESSASSIKPYLKLMRIDRPIGIWLLFWPCGWSIAMAASPGSLPPLDILGLFATGAMIMRGAGCTINDMWDKDIDGKVERTKDRPLVSGALSQWDALVFLSGQLGVGLFILLQLNWYSIILGTSSLGLVIIYPLMKRITYWPQLILGMTFNWGALLGWSAVHGSCNWSVCLPLYAAGICWTIVYDTIYAHQDKLDDLQLGIKSTAIKFSEDTKLVLSLFSGVMVAGLLVSGMQCTQTWPYYSSVALIAFHLANQLYTLKIDNPSDCGKKFLSNQRVGLFLFLGIVLGNLLKERPALDNKINLDDTLVLKK